MIVIPDQKTDTAAALSRLHVAAAAAEAWPVMRWRRVSGPGPDSLELTQSVFQGLSLQPGEALTLACTLSLPTTIAATPLAGDALDVTVFSLYPTTFSVNGAPLFDEAQPSVALGPALVRVCEHLQPADPAELRLTIHAPNNQMTTWCQLTFSTPRLRARFALLDLAWARLALAAQVASTPAELRALSDAADCVPADLENLSTAALAEPLQALTDALAPLAERLAEMRVHVVGHAHIDLNWLWTWPDTRAVIKRDLRSVLAIMDDYPDMTFTHSQPATYRVLQQEAPDLFARVVERIREGRWEPATMTWVEGDTNMASGEAMARQLLEGTSYSRAHLGAQPTVFMAPDTFGHAGNLPQLARSAGASVYYHHRCNPGYSTGEQAMWPAYWWEGQEGTRLLAVSTPSYNGRITAGTLAEAAIAAHRQGQPVSLLFHGVGDHGGGPARRSLDTLRSIQDVPAFLSARCSTVAAYARELLRTGVALPTHRGESATIFEGCYTTQSEVKRFNRHGENLLCTADTLAALAGFPYPSALQEAWRKILFHQFHDILDGSAIHEAYQLSEEDFHAASAAAAPVVETALGLLEAAVQTGAIAVTNPLGWDREDVVVVPGTHGEGAVWLRDSQGRVTPGQYTAHGLCFVARVPAFGNVGYTIDRDAAAPIPSPLAAVPSVSPAAGATPATDGPYYRIDTPFYRVHMSRESGILVSLYDKLAERELVGFGMRKFSDYPESARTDLALNVLQILDELPHDMSAWHLDEVQRETSLLRGAVSQVMESGPVRLVLQVRHVVRSSVITQLFAFYRDLPRIDVDTTIEWHELGGDTAGVADLKVAFTTQVAECEAWFETPFGAVQRPAGGQEVPALRWADVGGSSYGLAILNESRYGYDVLGNRIRLTLARGAYNPDSVADQGVHVTRYSILPHVGNWRDAGVVRQAASLNQPLAARLKPAGAAETTPLRGVWRPTVSDGSVLIACLKPAQAGDGVVIRLYESAGRASEVMLHGVPAEAEVFETTVVEDTIAILDRVGDSLHLSFRPWQVRTLLIKPR